VLAKEEVKTRERRIQAGPGGPADSIVSIGTAPSRQGPALDTSSTSAPPTLTALVHVGQVRGPGPPRRPDLGCGHFCGRPQLAIASGFVGPECPTSRQTPGWGWSSTRTEPGASASAPASLRPSSVVSWHAFADVTSGNTDMTGSNSGPFPAPANYDAATGIGSPYAAGLTCASVSSVSAGYSGSTVTVSGLGLEACRHRFRINPCDCAVRNRNIGRCHRACRRRHRHRLGFEHRRR
jgi:hypothetical protein